jgi:predicted phage terminase large subunit-like protein
MKAEFKILLRKDYRTFLQKALLELDGTKIDDDAYLDLLASEVRAFVSGRQRRVVANLPPGHLKTRCLSIGVCAWILAHQPSAKIIVVAHAEHMALTISRSVRRILQSEWFREVFPTRIAPDHAAVMDFETTAGGALFATSFGSNITGRRADWIIVDDPHDIADAANPERLERTIELFETVVISRLNNKLTGGIMVVGHRVHENDLSGHLARLEEWHRVVLPMVATSDATYSTDYGLWRRRKGELLRPNASDERQIERLKAGAHNPDFSMLYQQDADSYTLPPISPACFGSFTTFPSGSACVLSVDAGLTKGSRNAFSVVQVWCRVGEDHFLVDQWRDQCDFEELRSQVFRYILHYRPSAVLVEGAANGHALISAIKKSHHRRLVHEITPAGSKAARLRPHVETILARRIFLPEHAAWRAGFVAEFVGFPHGPFNDQVDATAQYLTWIAERPPLASPAPRCMGALGNQRSLIAGPTPIGGFPVIGGRRAYVFVRKK